MLLTLKDIRDIQVVAKDMLSTYVDVCDKLNLHYYINYGTLIGAIRHKGFIPWDDDVDVVMPRDDYEKFLTEAPSLLGGNYFLQTPDTENNYLFSFAKLRKSDTTYIENRGVNINMNHGLWLDIFCLDDAPVSFFDKLRVNTLRRINDAAYFDIQKSPEERREYSLLRKFAIFILRKLYPKLCVAGKRNYKLYGSVKPCNLFYNHNSPYCERLPKEWFGDGVLVDFEGIKVKAPTEYDKVLRAIYGDYMKLPPEEKRIPNHEVAYFDLNKSYTEYIK